MASPLAPVTFESFTAELSRLVARFDAQYPTFTSPDYLEATLRSDFLDPFFRALGWDVGNQKGLIHTEREVDIEVRTATSGRQTRADYVFRIARTDRFTCEAKKPAEALHNRHIFQAKRDAFNRGIPLALLSDFEELKIYVVGARPILDEPHTGELKVFHFRQYPDVARELWDLLAYENVAAGAIDRKLDSLPKRPLKLKGKQGWLIKPDRTRSLDSDFLNFLDDVRQQLGSDLLKHNDRADLLSGHRLNEAAQRIIDRLVFLRICEDRGIDTGTLLETLFNGWYRQQPESHQPKLRKVSHQTNLRFGGAESKAGGGGAVEDDPAAYDSARARTPTEGGLYRELVDHIRALDQRPPSYKPFFNGQLFKPHFSEDLVVGDEWLANFILDLTSDDTGYNFADIKVEILGDAYERFLGHILVPKGRGTAIEEKPEVRKAGGVYYTPRYITDYIVEQTIGRLLEGKTPRQVEKLRFLDPACGSGSFLIRAYERVMEHYLRYYNTLAVELAAKPENTGKTKGELLARHRDDCFVDLAGNVRLTTALKRRILEANIYGVDIDAQAVEVTQLSLYLKMLEGENRDTLRAQTELFRTEPLLPSLQENIKCFNSLVGTDFSSVGEDLTRVNAGDWDIQFETIIRSGGFDAIIGNPPYGAALDQQSIEYLKTIFKNSGRETDTYAIFMEQSYRISRPGALIAMIVPTGWYSGAKFPLLRRFFATHFDPAAFINLPYDVFADAWVDTTVFVASRRSKPTNWPRSEICEVRITTFPKKHKIVSRDEFEANASTANFAEWFETGNDVFLTYSNQNASRLIKRMEAQAVPFGSYADIQRGVTPFHTISTPPTENPRAAFSGSIRRYITEPAAPAFIRYDESLAEFKPEKYFVGPRILLRELISRQFQLQACLVESDFITNKSMQSALAISGGPRLQFLLGCLNSRLLSWYFLQKSNIAQRDDFPKIVLKETRSLPFPKINLTEKNSRQLHDRLVALVDKMLTLTPALRAAKTDAEKATLQNAVKKTDREIDQLVYQLYGLTPDEIALVEGTDAPAPQAD